MDANCQYLTNNLRGILGRFPLFMYFLQWVKNRKRVFFGKFPHGPSHPLFQVTGSHKAPYGSSGSINSGQDVGQNQNCRSQLLMQCLWQTTHNSQSLPSRHHAYLWVTFLGHPIDLEAVLLNHTEIPRAAHLGTYFNLFHYVGKSDLVCLTTTPVTCLASKTSQWFMFSQALHGCFTQNSFSRAVAISSNFTYYSKSIHVLTTDGALCKPRSHSLPKPPPIEALSGSVRLAPSC
jgi:hypothetical protein